MGLSANLAKPSHYWVYQASQPSQYTIGFIRLPKQANIPLGLSSCQPSQSTFGFIKLLSQWKGRMAKILAHSRARDTSTRSIWPGIHITCTQTQGSIPFSTTQSLGLYLPFQCSSGHEKKNHQPLLSFFEVPLFTRSSIPFSISSTPKSCIQFRPKPGCTS